MKIRLAHRPEVTKRPAWRAPAAGASAVAGLALLLHPAHTATTQTTTDDTGPGLTQVRAGFAEVLIAEHRQLDAALAPYTVRAGDSLSGVAARKCGNSADWTGIYAASRKAHETAWNANDLVAGQHLTIQCYQNPGMADRAPLPPPPPVTVTTTPAGSTSLTSVNVSTPVQSHRSAASTASGGSTANVSPSSYSGYQACVVERESGGQSQVMNASGHYGLYQFDYGTWVSGGGSPATFGRASVAEQDRVFAAVYAARGTQPWSPSDGC